MHVSLLSHGQNDPILLAVFVLLVGMSVVSWYIIFWKMWKLYKEKKLLSQFQGQYLAVPDWPLRIATIGMVEGSVGVLIKEAKRMQSILPGYPSDEQQKIMAMHLSHVLDVVRSWFDRGLTVLASVGSSAPFVGLFGTVWGIYNTLTRISAEGNATLNVVAGPMGEALVATAIGLFAAIPAVLAYNGFVRMNRVVIQDLRHIAEQLAQYIPLLPVMQAVPGNAKTVRG